MTLFDISKIMYKLDPDGPKSVLETIVSKAEEIYSIVKSSVSKGLYLQLNDIHMKLKKDMPQVRLVSSNSKTTAEFSTGEKDARQQGSGEITPTKSPGQLAKKMIFHDSSQVAVSGFGSSKQSNEGRRKRAQSVYQGEEEINEGVVRLDPLILEKGRSRLFIYQGDEPGKSIWNNSPPLKKAKGASIEELKDSNKTFHRTATKEPSSHIGEGRKLRKTISNPDLRCSPKIIDAGPKLETKKHEGTRSLT